MLLLYGNLYSKNSDASYLTLFLFLQFVEEKRALEEAERRASEEYIQRLLVEEEERVNEERRRQEERQLEDDERLARLLSEELVSMQTVLHFVLLLS